MFKLIENLDNYFILKEEGDEVIIGTYVTLRVTDTKNKNVFQPTRPPIDKEFPVFFLISCAKKESKIKNTFRKNGLPILSLDNKEKMPETAEDFRKKLNEFVYKNF